MLITCIIFLVNWKLRIPKKTIISINYLIFRQERNQYFEKKTNFMRPYKVNYVTLFQSAEVNKHTLKFIKSSFPQRVAELRINCSQDPYLYIFPISNLILEVSSKVLEKIVIDGFIISAYQFKRIMACCKHLRKIFFWRCNISIPSVFNFSQTLKNTKIKMLDFDCSGNSTFTNWEEGFEEFQNLIQGLATSPDLKKSLQEFKARNCCIEEEIIREILEENGFNNVQIFA
ncbi:unnamed protein product [Moneuplotes crassus]|uniref:Uncharacterized protein n=1 Tax=Euplotes crassus TaxID=5936 RepID=A0AAD1XA86_EUPCR|nr:unnamed protein product [Moneuplotes crassus]